MEKLQILKDKAKDLKKKTEDVKSQIDQLEGQKKAILADLKSMGYNNIELAEEGMKKLESSIDENIKKLETGIEQVSNLFEKVDLDSDANS